MNYKKIYDDFIKDRREKEETLTGYSEKHHIIPRARGGDDSFENIIKLSALDHLHAHLLLAKVYGGVMWYPIYFMIKKASKDNKIPTKLQIRWAARARNNIPPKSEETKQKMSLANIGKKLSEEHKKKIALASIGKKMSEETRRKLSLANIGKKMSEETKQKIALAKKGKNLSEEHKKKMSLAKKGKKMSEEHKQKIGLASTGRAHSEESKQKMSLARRKPIKCNTTNQVFKCVTDSAEHFKISKSAILGSIKNSTTLKRIGLSFSHV